MSGDRAPASFAAWGTAVSAACGIAGWIASQAGGLGAGSWLVIGWLSAAVPGVAGGAWLQSRFGRPGAGFLVPLGVSMGIRAVAMAVGLSAALRSAGSARWTFLVGFGAAFLPLTVFEAVWFSRRAKTNP